MLPNKTETKKAQKKWKNIIRELKDKNQDKENKTKEAADRTEKLTGKRVFLEKVAQILFEKESIA